MLIDKTIDALLLVCQKEPEPFNNVLLKKSGAAYVTDGKMAAKADVCSFSNEEFPGDLSRVDDDILLNSGLIAEAVKTRPKKGAPILTQNIAVDSAEGSVTLRTSDGKRTRSVSDRLPKDNHPSVEEIMCRVFDMNDGLRINVNVLLLEKLVKMAKKHGVDAVKMAVRPEHICMEVGSIQVLMLTTTIEEEDK